MICCGTQAEPPEIRAMAERLVPKVNIDGDAEFFAAWDLDYPGLEAVKAAVEADTYRKAKVELKKYFLVRRKPRWRINHWQMPNKPRGKPEEHSKYKQGEDVLAHRFRGYQFGKKIDWNCYPKKRPDGSPDTEFTTSPVDFRHASQVLGPLYWYSHDERYAKEFVYEITDFITTWPPPEKYRSRKSPGCWSRLRAVGPLCGVWEDAYNFFLPSKHFTPEAHAIMLEGFIEKARYAVRNPDRVNRYLVQLRGIYTVGCYFPELRQADGFRKLAVAAMVAAVDAEFYPDTSSKEACPGYQGMYTSALYGMVESAHIMGYQMPPKLREAFEHCCDFYVRMVTPLHGLPQFGDTGSHVRLAKIFRLNVTPFIDKPEYHWMASRGSKGSPPAYTSIRLPYAGFYVMRSGWDRQSLYLCFDAGPLGKGHWHEDFGNFECFAYGARLIADMGVYSYVFSEWRQYFVSSLAHNVVLVDGLSQNRAGSPRKPGLITADEPRSNDWHSDDVFDLAWGFYDARWGDYRDGNHWFKGYGRDQAVKLATHRRDVCFVKDRYWIVSDRLAAKGEHMYSQLFHFEPKRRAKVLGPGRAGTVDVGRPNIVFVQADPLAARIAEGQEKPVPRGWCALGGFKKAPAPVVIFEQKATDRVFYDTVLYPLRVGEEANVSVERLTVTDEAGTTVPAVDVCALRIVSGEGTDYYINDLRQREIGPANGRVKIAGPLKTDTRAAIVRLDANGKPLKASAVGGSYVMFSKRPIWRQ